MKTSLSNLSGPQLIKALDLPQVQESINKSRERFAVLKVQIDIAIERISPDNTSTASDPQYQDTLDELIRVRSALSSVDYDFHYIAKEFTRSVARVSDNFDHQLLPPQIQSLQDIEEWLTNMDIPYTIPTLDHEAQLIILNLYSKLTPLPLPDPIVTLTILTDGGMTLTNSSQPLEPPHVEGDPYYLYQTKKTIRNLYNL